MSEPLDQLPWFWFLVVSAVGLLVLVIVIGRAERAAERNRSTKEEEAMKDAAAASRRLSPEERYARDQNFRTFTDMIEHFVHRAELTPSEVREATVLACIHYEMRRLRDIYVRTDEDAVRMIGEGKARLDEMEKRITEGGGL